MLGTEINSTGYLKEVLAVHFLCQQTPELLLCYIGLYIIMRAWGEEEGEGGSSQ